MIKGYTYDEFGNLAQSGVGSFLNEVTFTGSVTDTSSGLQYMNARYYQPSTGRFLSQDSYTGNPYDPWTQNLYSYCGNNPTNMIDPTGHFVIAIPLVVGAVTALLKAVGVVAAGYATYELGKKVVDNINIQDWTTEYAPQPGYRPEESDATATGAGKIVGKIAAAATVAAIEGARSNDKTNNNDKHNTVYVIKDRTTKEVKYVGRTTNETAREYYHTKIDSEKYTSKYLGDIFYPVAQGLSKAEARGLEQKLIDQYWGPMLGNKINGISPNNPNYEKYMNAAKDFLMDRAENELLDMLGL